MGKRKYRQNVSSIAHFLKELKESREPSQAQDSEELEVEQTVVETAISESQILTSSPSTKRRRIGVLGPGYEKYDKTGLAERYEDESEAPEHLKKCTFSLYG